MGLEVPRSKDIHPLMHEFKDTLHKAGEEVNEVSNIRVTIFGK
jgi:hypothetical protein